MSDDHEVDEHLGAALAELIDVIQETKQAVWSATSANHRRTLETLKSFLVEQAAVVSDAEERIDGRSPAILSPTGHHQRNLLAEAAGDPTRLMDLLIGNLVGVAADLRRRSESLDDEWQRVFLQIAEGVDSHVAALQHL